MTEIGRRLRKFCEQDVQSFKSLRNNVNTNQTTQKLDSGPCMGRLPSWRSIPAEYRIMYPCSYIKQYIGTWNPCIWTDQDCTVRTSGWILEPLRQEVHRILFRNAVLTSQTTYYVSVTEVNISVALSSDKKVSTRPVNTHIETNLEFPKPSKKFHEENR